MKKLVLFIFLISTIVVSEGCSRKSGCPTYDKKSDSYKVKGGNKTKSGLFPNKMR